MSHDDDHRHDPRHDPRRGAYTPPDDDDLPFRRSGFDARPGGRRLDRGGGGRPVPVTLIVSAAVLLVLILAVVLFYRSGLRASEDAPAVGQPVEQMTVPPVDAQPVDPQLGIDVYDPAAEPDEPQFAPPPEAVQPRPEPQPLPTTPSTPPPIPGPPPAKTAPAPAPTPAPTPAPPAEKTRPAPAPATGSASVQIGAFSSRALADREYAAVAGAFPSFASGRTKSVEQVTTSAGSTAYRTAMSGFTRAEAQEFCAALRAGGRECFVR